MFGGFYKRWQWRMGRFTDAAVRTSHEWEEKERKKGFWTEEKKVLNSYPMFLKDYILKLKGKRLGLSDPCLVVTSHLF